MGMLDWLFGEAPKFQPGQFGASRPFPSQDDVEFARKYGEFQHGGEFTPNTFEASNENIGDTNTTKGIRILAEMGELPSPSDQTLIDTLARNKLASRRSAIASLGMNDSEDNVVGAKDFTFDSFAGKTMKQDDHPLFTFFGNEGDGITPSTPTHEAIHRGLFKIVDELEGMPNDEETSRLRNFLNDGHENELTVRWLMNNLYDDPERVRMPEVYQTFLDDPNGAYKRDQVEEMAKLAETIAQKMVQRRKPGGPW